MDISIFQVPTGEIAGKRRLHAPTGGVAVGTSSIDGKSTDIGVDGKDTE